MNYIQLHIPATGVDQAEIYMAELADMPFESFETEEWGLKAYIREDELEKCRVELDAFLASHTLTGVFTTIETVNWNERWESNFQPVDVEGTCLIRAPFHSAPPKGVLDIIIMPKMSFGTGHHATTWLMSAAIMEMDVSMKKGLDMGSGTGVLAVIAAKRGAAHVDAVDIDEWAFENGTENAAANGVARLVTPVMGDIESVPREDYDFILANINRNILLADMSRYVEVLVEGGTLVMSGFLEKDTTSIDDRARSLGLTLKNMKVREGWVALTYLK